MTILVNKWHYHRKVNVWDLKVRPLFRRFFSSIESYIWSVPYQCNYSGDCLNTDQPLQNLLIEKELLVILRIICRLWASVSFLGLSWLDLR